MRNELVCLLAKRPRTVVFVTHDIEEAAQLADRVLVLSNRPSYICRELIIDAPRPRDLTDSAVIEAMNAILNELGLHTWSKPNMQNCDNSDYFVNDLVNRKQA
jgi:NitT/TauT family transport system ATP-binding protein